MKYYEQIKDRLKDQMGKFRTGSLFLEPLYDETNDTVFTLKDYDHTHKGRFHYSLKKIYLEIADPTEYRFAIEVFNSWEHWQRISKNGTISPFVDKWRDELEVKLRSLSINNIIETAKVIDSKALPAMKWLAEGGWRISKRGRISKEDKEVEVKKEAGILRSINEDLKRISKA